MAHDGKKLLDIIPPETFADYDQQLSGNGTESSTLFAAGRGVGSWPSKAAPRREVDDHRRRHHLPRHHVSCDVRHLQCSSQPLVHVGLLVLCKSPEEEHVRRENSLLLALLLHHLQI